MTIAPRLREYLDEVNADYDVIDHQPTKSSLETASASSVPAEKVAKAVLLDTDDDYLLAVLPSDRRVELSELRSELGRKPRLASEDEIKSLFSDCDVGAIPPVGYGLQVIVDDAIDQQPDVYFEAGDHASLVHMKHDGFSRLMQGARHGQFSEPTLID
jgi:Ala-tRNA(Pro) deacylase